MVSGGGNCNVGIDLTLNDPSSISHCNVSSLDLSTCGTKNTLHACVESPCISSRNCLNKSCDDMLAMSCCHNTNASISSSLCDANIIEETEDTLGQDKVLNGASRNSSSSPSLDSYICLMARASKVTRSLEPNISCDDEDDDSEEDNDDDIASLNEKGKMIFHALRKNKNACSNFVEILTIAIESKKLIKEHEDTIFEMEGHAREYADEIADLKEALEEEQTTKESLEETFALELSKVKETHDRALEVANSLQTKNDVLVVVYAKLLEDFEHLKNGSRVVKGELIKLTESHEQLKASYSKERIKLPSPIGINDDACATNSISCEASILKENVELSAQLELLANNYGKLEESHEKLSSRRRHTRFSGVTGVQTCALPI